MTDIGVIGVGERGRGIALICALAGCRVSLCGLRPADADDALVELTQILDVAVEAGRLPADARRLALENLHPTRLMTAVQTDLVIEVIPEKLSAKQRLFEDIELAAKPATVFASGTASIPIAAIGSGLLDKGRLVGLHFVDPERQGSLLEVVQSEHTRPEVTEQALAFGEQLGKTVVSVQDRAGFVHSRLAVLLTMECARMVDEGLASAKDIDEVMVTGHGHPIGPLRLADLAGLDTRVWMGEHLATALGSAIYRAPESLRAKVEAGDLGQKSGRGYFEWSD